MPESYPAAVDVLLRSLGPEHAPEELIGAGMAPFFSLLVIVPHDKGQEVTDAIDAMDSRQS